MRLGWPRCTRLITTWGSGWTFRRRPWSLVRPVPCLALLFWPRSRFCPVYSEIYSLYIKQYLFAFHSRHAPGSAALHIVKNIYFIHSKMYLLFILAMLQVLP